MIRLDQLDEVVAYISDSEPQLFELAVKLFGALHRLCAVCGQGAFYPMRKAGRERASAEQVSRCKCILERLPTPLYLLARATPTNLKNDARAGYCARSHDNGFNHLSAALGGLEEECDLGYKFTSEKEGHGEPFLPIHVSVRHRSKEGVPGSMLPVLHYGLTREDYANRLSVLPEDYERLFNRVLRHVKPDVAAIHSRGRPSHLNRDRPKRLR